MGSDETATATTGGPRVIDVFSGDGCHRAQISYLFRMQIGARTRSGIDLGSDGPLDRICAGAWGSPESSGSKTWGDHGSCLRTAEHLY